MVAYLRRSLNWKIKLLLGGVDVSANLTNLLRIEAEEGTAKIAEFSLIPHAGPISVTKWIGKTVKIFYHSGEQESCIFEGIVDEPVYDPTTMITTFTCTDQFQEKIQRLSKYKIDQIIKSYWSPIVFDSTSDNWNYAQDQLSTIPASLDLTTENGFQLSPWQAKTDADFIFTEDDVLYQSIQVQLANRREIHNQVNILFQYRYQRLKQREIYFGYGYPLSFCEQNYRSATLPNVEMIQQAVEGTGWLLKGNIVYEHQRHSGWITCGEVTFAFLIKEEIRRYLVREAHFALMKRFYQSVTENYHLQLKAPQSIAQLDEISSDETMSFEVPSDTERFTNIQHYTEPLAGSVLNSEGDYIFEMQDRAALDQAILTKLNQAKVNILKSHRNNLISFKTPLRPEVERHHTIKLDTNRVIAQGKVKHIIHECDFNQGSCLTTLTLAISRTDNETEVLETPLGILEENAPNVEGVPLRIPLPTHLGGRLSSPVYDESWDGYIGNEKLEPNAKPYPERFAVTIPSIENAQSPVDLDLSYSFDISIPNELLLLSA